MTLPLQVYWWAVFTKNRQHKTLKNLFPWCKTKLSLARLLSPASRDFPGNSGGGPLSWFSCDCICIFDLLICLACKGDCEEPHYFLGNNVGDYTTFKLSLLCHKAPHSHTLLPWSSKYSVPEKTPKKSQPLNMDYKMQFRIIFANVITHLKCFPFICFFPLSDSGPLRLGKNLQSFLVL